MTYRKKTLRRMSPTARKVARLAGELDSVARRLKNLVPDLQRLDLDSEALTTAKGQRDCYWRIGNYCYADETAFPVPCGKEYDKCSLYKPRD